jgi:predicted lipoprotein with Yx(FWY)xxD motif
MKEDAMSKPLGLVLAVVLAALVLVATATPADTMSAPLVRTIANKQLGQVLATAGKQAIYVWNREPKGKIRCTGTCAKAWPPVLVKKGVVVPMHVKGIMGEFGTIRRAGGARQLTFNRRALYTYAHEKPGQVLCNNVGGWFAVKVHG